MERILVSFYRFDKAVDSVTVVCRDPHGHRLFDERFTSEQCLIVEDELNEFADFVSRREGK